MNKNKANIFRNVIGTKAILFIPVRGRKRAHRIAPFRISVIFYPREGTVTINTQEKLLRRLMMIFYPRKGTETKLGGCHA